MDTLKEPIDALGSEALRLGSTLEASSLPRWIFLTSLVRKRDGPDAPLLFARGADRLYMVNN